MIDYIVKLLTAAADQGKPVPLHELIWTVDAKHHAIPTVDDLDTALTESGDFRIERTVEQVTLVPVHGTESDSITEKDIVVAMSFYENMVKEVLGR